NEFRRQIADLEKAGIISKSKSQYNTPALFVKQKEKWRLVLDFRKLNEITLTLDFAIPTLDDILHEVSGANYFSALDMKSAFNQIPLHFRDRHKTAFSTPDDDIILFTKTTDEHFELLGKVLERFGRIQLKFNPGKCQFLTKSGKFLGVVVTPEGILIDKDKFISISEFPVPTDQKQIKSFLGCCNFYRRCIKNFAKRALPLTNLLRKDTPFEWTCETQAAFDDFKKAILNPPVLALPDPDAELQITTDASSHVADHHSRYINNITIALPESKDLIEMQRVDPVLGRIIQKIHQNDVSPQISSYFINGEGLLCHLSKRPSRSPRSTTTRKQVCIPHCLKAKILESIHSEYGGHLKFFKIYYRLSENFFWQNMYKDAKKFVRSCIICLSRKNAFKIPPAPHQPVEQSQELGETCHIDIFGPLKTTPKDNSLPGDTEVKSIVSSQVPFLFSQPRRTKMTSRSADLSLWFLLPSTTPEARLLQAFLSLFSIRCTQTEKKRTGGVLALHPLELGFGVCAGGVTSDTVLRNGSRVRVGGTICCGFVECKVFFVI
ncbi:retrovirus-related Pol polyprotein from transposon 17.6, partial [Trichonephila clavipes]